MPINFESDVLVLPNLAESIYVFGQTVEVPSVRKIEAHSWVAEGLLGNDDYSRADIGLLVYPNPASSVLYFNTESQISKILLYSIWGEKMKELDQSSNSMIDVSDLKTGVYILSFFNENNYLVSKILVIE